MTKRALLLFVKYPQLGKVKTRLAQTVGDKQAAEIYKTIVESILQEIKVLHGSVCDVWISIDPPERENDVKRWLGEELYFTVQQGNDLTERLVHAFSNVFAKGYESVVVIGSDTLGFRKQIVHEAFAQLSRHDVVLGPAKDGGYYLIGLKQIASDIFQDISWSTPSVLSQTIQKIQNMSWSYFLLEELEDLDELKQGEGWSFLKMRKV